MTTMSINDERIPIDTEAYYEAIASQEEVYLEEVEEELRAILIFGNRSDDPPLSEEMVAEMLRMTQIPKGLGRIGRIDET
jgi:hypothetical protein